VNLLTQEDTEMAQQEIQDQQEKKPVDGGWALLFFVILFLGVILLGWFTL